MESSRVTSPFPVRKLILAHNEAWYALYYDQLVMSQACQLSLVSDPSAPAFMNTAQGVALDDDVTLDEIEAFYRGSGLPAAVFLDPESPQTLRTTLAKRGYYAHPDKNERWYVLPLQSPVLKDQWGLLHIEDYRVEIVEVFPDDDASFEQFLDVDAETQQLSQALVVKLRDHLKTRQNTGVQWSLFLAAVDGKPAATGAVGLCKGIALFAEGGTLPEFQRQGIYNALLEHRLIRAHEQRADYCVMTCGMTAHSAEACAARGFTLAWTREYYSRPL